MDKLKEAKNAVTGQKSAEQVAQNPKDAKKDTTVDSAVDHFANKKGMPAAANPELNNVVNDEINKF
ncbi:hypothetical protein F5Y16DRAFT_233551 [Xylariaceae sp. FL0255]|nr:hypothetical protein F5Y16DRAFT_233551 [Xylariaceae sp. FL0255]